AHFVALCSATAGDPRPCFSPLQLTWLRKDLERNADRRPVFVILHHAPDSDKLAPSQVLELRAAFDGHDIAALFFASKGQPQHRQVAGIDCVGCGSASTASVSASPEARGYALVSIAGGRLRVAHRNLDSAQQPLLLLEKPLRYRVQAPFSIEAPLAGAPARERELDVVVLGPNVPLTLLVDGEPKALGWRREADRWRARLPVQDLAGGAHQIAVSCDDSGTPRLATRLFVTPSPEVTVVWRRSFEGSLRSPPVLSGDRLSIASTAGEVAVLEAGNGALIWTARTAGVLGSPWCGEDGTVVVSNTAGWVEAYDRAGVLTWRFQLGRPALAGVTGDGELVFATDESGMVHALELATGHRRWHRKTGESEAAASASAPREVGGRAAEVSETGVVTLLDTASRESLWTWRATAGGFTTAAPLVGADGTVWIAGLDGWLSAIRAR
ncbi:MAG: PQQ-binding-like beta-propeller repeat protein, partial [Planctomycetota bacterium]